MSSLTKFLVTEKHKPSMGKSGLKTPLTLRCHLSPEIGVFCVSTSKGDFLVVRNSRAGEVLSNFFPLELEDEDKAHALLAEFLFAEGEKRGWSGVLTMPKVTSQDVEDIGNYFESYSLNWYQTFVGMEAYNHLVSEGLVTGVDRKVTDTHADDESLSLMMENHFVVGHFGARPLYYNQHLTNLIVCSADPNYVGMLTRSRDVVSVVLHNVERGVVIIDVPQGTE